ncbi:MAG: sodium:calcium antiporter [Rhodospirillales bacterium]|nr:MAG: sodium:calcium antiporter [Rhodospirillales bacterium]
MVTALQIVAGFLLLLGGAELLVRGSVTVARRLGVSTILIGMTVVAFGTSAPELVVSLEAALAESPDIAVGNIVGSNVANVFLILGLTGLLRPIEPRPSPMVYDTGVLIAGTLLFALILLSGDITSEAGLLLLFAFAAFMVVAFWRETRGPGDAAVDSRRQEAEDMGRLPGGLWGAWAAVVFGLAGLLVGSAFLVEGGTTAARTLGVPEAVIGLTLIAIGTSLPELAASVVAGLRGHTDVAVGNVLGSNLFNMLLVGGAVAVVVPLPVASQIVSFDLWIMLLATLVFLPFLLGGRLGRKTGTAFLLLYVAYVTVQYSGGLGIIPWAPAGMP